MAKGEYTDKRAWQLNKQRPATKEWIQRHYRKAMTTPEVAEAEGVSTATVNSWIRHGTEPGSKARPRKRAYLLDTSRLASEKRCPKCERTLPASEFRTKQRTHRTGTVSTVLDAYCLECRSTYQREYARLVPKDIKSAYARKRRARDPRPRVVDRWYDAKRRGHGMSLEDYADHAERAKMGCNPSDWAAWQENPPPDKPARVDRDALRARADRLQRPVRDPNGRRVWPSDWGSALRFTWQYANDEAFRAKEIERTRLRKYTMPSYGASSELTPSGKRKWQRAADQMGKVTRAHIRREMRAKLCSYCLEPLTADNRHLDHIDPLCKGGAHDDGNIIASCSSCNMSKGRKSLIGWLMVMAG